jgi:GTP-binding protein YchF
MNAGLVGFPLAGKTTLFNAITMLHKSGDSHLHLGAIKVPDRRVDQLAALYRPRKVTYAEVRFVDLPGPRGKGMDADSLRALSDVDALCLVVRGFAGMDGAAPDPLRDLREFDAELVLYDLGVVERRLDRLRKEHAGKTGSEWHELSNLLGHLEAGQPLRTLRWSEAEQRELAHFGFLSRRPLLVVLNVAEGDAASPLAPELEAEIRARGAEGLALSAEVEAEIADLDPSEQPAFLESIGLREPARERFIRAAYHLLDLASFFTVGEDEVRAWTIHRGDRAPRAAGRIHSDLERGFIRAEVVHYEDFMAAGGEAKARERGRMRLEGKEYVVRDGDILHVRAAV